jgi:hypothetical protein
MIWPCALIDFYVTLTGPTGCVCRVYSEGPALISEGNAVRNAIPEVVHYRIEENRSRAHSFFITPYRWLHQYTVGQYTSYRVL